MHSIIIAQKCFVISTSMNTVVSAIDASENAVKLCLEWVDEWLCNCFSFYQFIVVKYQLQVLVFNPTFFISVVQRSMHSDAFVGKNIAQKTTTCTMHSQPQNFDRCEQKERRF